MIKDTSYCLVGVVSLPEAALLWHKNRKSVEMQVNKGRLEWRKAITGGTIFITVASLRRLWGEPSQEVIAWPQERR